MASTTSNVGALVSYMTGTAATASSNQILKTNGSKAAASFDNVLNKVSDTMMNTKSVETPKNEVRDNTGAAAQGKEQIKTYNTSDKLKNNDNKAAIDDKAAKEEGNKVADDRNGLKGSTKGDVSKEAMEEIEKAGEEIASEVSEILDISEEDLVNMMQMLGLSFADLFNPESLQQLVTAIGGQEQALDLITDSDIYTSLQDLIEGAESMKNELMNELGLSEEDFTSLVENIETNTFNVSQKEVLEEAPAEVIEDAGSKDQKILYKPFKEAPQSEDVRQSDEPVIDRPVVIDRQSESSSQQNGNHFQNGSESANLFNQIVENIAEAAAPEAAETISYTDRMQMENIVRQITEKITITNTSEESSIELQLHPASLGNVNILLSSSKDGIVAKFTAQNQIVKEAVETQMVQLQQKFEEQGIKVTSIEVTIASHAFEQNLQQQDRNGQEDASSSPKKNLRRINLVDMTEDEEEEMTEAERIAASMMAMNGNTVDFSA